MRDPWNILDFIIVIAAYVEYLPVGSSSVDLTALRSFRVLRPLKSIKGIEGLKIIVVTLLNSMRLL